MLVKFQDHFPNSDKSIWVNVDNVLYVETCKDDFSRIVFNTSVREHLSSVYVKGSVEEVANKLNQQNRKETE